MKTENVTMTKVATLDVFEKEDRSEVCRILAKNGYAAMQSTRKSATGRSNVYTVEVYRKYGEETNGN